MFHRDGPCREHAAAMERHAASLLARISDLELANERLLDKLSEEREAAGKRETELTDRLLAIVNPMAARSVAVMRSTAPAAVPPVLDRPTAQAGVPRRRPVLTPRSSNFRPLFDFMERQRVRASVGVGAQTTEPEPGPEPGPGGEEEAADMRDSPSATSTSTPPPEEPFPEMLTYEEPIPEKSVS